MKRQHCHIFPVFSNYYLRPSIVSLTLSSMKLMSPSYDSIDSRHLYLLRTVWPHVPAWNRFCEMMVLYRFLQTKTPWLSLELWQAMMSRFWVSHVVERLFWNAFLHRNRWRELQEHTFPKAIFRKNTCLLSHCKAFQSETDVWWDENIYDRNATKLREFLTHQTQNDFRSHVAARSSKSRHIIQSISCRVSFV